MTDATNPAPVEPITFAGGDVPPPLDPAGDRGDFIFSPATSVDTPVVEPVTEPTPVPPPVEAAPEPAPEPALGEPASVETTASESVEERVRNKKDFLERLQAKNRKIQQLEARLLSQPVAEPTLATPTQNVTPVATPTVDLAALRIQAMQLMVDGKFEEAAAVQEQLETAVYERARTDIAAKATADAVDSVRQAAVNETVEQAASALAADYDVLDADSANYDNKAVRLINTTIEDYLREGHGPAEALRLAADEILRLKYPAFFTPDPVPPVVTAPAPAPAPRRADPATSVQRASQQPPVASGVSTRTEAEAPVDIWSLSDNEFASLSAATLSQLRGDTL